SCVRDILFENSVINKCGLGWRISGADCSDSPTGSGIFPSSQTKRVHIKNVAMLNVSQYPYYDGEAGGLPEFFGLTTTANMPMRDVVIENILCLYGPSPDTSAGGDMMGFWSNEFLLTAANMVVRNNIFEVGNYSIIGNSSSPGTVALTNYVSGSSFADNLLINRSVDSSYSSQSGLNFPAGNYEPQSVAAVGFTNESTQNYALATGTTYKGVGTDGNDPGPNWSLMPSLGSNLAVAYTVVPPSPSSGTVNVASANFIVTPNGLFTGTITPAVSGITGTFSPTSLTWSGTADAKTFTFTPTQVGTATISATSGGLLIDPSGVAYVSNVIGSGPSITTNPSNE